MFPTTESLARCGFLIILVNRPLIYKRPTNMETVNCRGERASCRLCRAIWRLLLQI